MLLSARGTETSGRVHTRRLIVIGPMESEDREGAPDSRKGGLWVAIALRVCCILYTYVDTHTRLLYRLGFICVVLGFQALFLPINFFFYCP